MIVERPLTGIGGGETIRDVHQDTPFSMVALTADDLTGTEARVRAQQARRVVGSLVRGRDPRRRRRGCHPRPRGTDPVFVGRTTDVQIAVTRPAGRAGRRGGARGRPAPTGLGYLPANAEQPLAPNFNAVLISPPEAPVDIERQPADGGVGPGQPPNIIGRAAVGRRRGAASAETPCTTTGFAPPSCTTPQAATTTSHGDSAGIVRSIYEYHTRTLGWCDIAYNALVDKYGQVFEGRAGGMDRPVEGAHTGGFNENTWGVAMMGDFETVPPTPIQLRTTGRLLGWRLGLDHVDPQGHRRADVRGRLASPTSPGASPPTLPTIFTHRDVGNTECPGNAAYAEMDLLRDIAARFNAPFAPRRSPTRCAAARSSPSGRDGRRDASPLGAPTSPEASGDGDARYVTFQRGAMYWSPESGAEPVTGAIYDAWGTLGFERGALGLPTSGEIHEPQWIVQNFQHGTLNFDREKGTVTRVIDGVPLELPPSYPRPAGAAGAVHAHRP